VAATGKLLGHALDALFDEWTALDYGSELSDLRLQLNEETAQFKLTTDILKAKQREVIDYYASDLADMAVNLVNSWLMLQDGRVSERKRELARLYINQHLGQVQQARQAITNSGNMPFTMIGSIFTIA
jgi:hypothetical protein